MKISHSYIYSLLFFLLVCAGVSAQTDGVSRTDSVRSRASHQIGFDIRPGYVVPIRSFFSGFNASGKPIDQAFAFHLKYAFRFSPDSYFGRMYPYAYQGIGVSYSSCGNRQEMGTPVTVYAFQGSRIARLAPNLTLDYEWNFGASFGWKEFNSETNPYNVIVGSEINAYINVGFLLNWRIAPHWHLNAGVDLTHYSNGNTNYPNMGVNTIGGRIGIVRTFGGEDERETRRRSDLLSVRPHMSYDLVVYGATRKRGVIEPDDRYMVSGVFAVAGLNFTPMYNFNKYFRAGISVDAQYDESANIKDHVAETGEEGEHRFYRPPFDEQFAVGLSARAELVMPLFSVNVGVGRNLIHKGEDTGGTYQILALKTSITRNLFLHVGYQLSKFKDPNNLMLGLGYRFHSKRGSDRH